MDRASRKVSEKESDLLPLPPSWIEVIVPARQQPSDDHGVTSMRLKVTRKMAELRGKEPGYCKNLGFL